MSEPEEYVINLDLDRDRIKTILFETYRICSETLETGFNITSEEFSSKVNIYLDSNRVSTPIFLNLPSRNYPELRIDVNLRRKSVIARLGNRKKQILINRFLTKL